MSERPSALGRWYRAAYDFLCGRHPEVLPWHFQWIAGVYLYRSLRRVLGGLGGNVLDAGCGSTPYRGWFKHVDKYVGLDLEAGPHVDIVVRPDEVWPLEGEQFDVVLASQVLEHVEDNGRLLRQVDRVLRPGGVVVLSFPFLYNEHGIPYDFLRFTAYSVPQLLPSYEIVHLERQGGVGSTIALLLLNWIDQSLNRRSGLRFAKGLLLPVFLPFALCVNLIAVLVDQLDRTDAFYSNLLVVFRKPEALPGVRDP